MQRGADAEATASLYCLARLQASPGKARLKPPAGLSLRTREPTGEIRYGHVAFSMHNELFGGSQAS
jgi:hypothetical protein